MLPPSAKAEHESEECPKDLDSQAVTHFKHFNKTLYRSPDDDSIRSALTKVIDVTNSPYPTVISSVPSATVINPRILDISTTNLVWLEDKHQHFNKYDLRE